MNWDSPLESESERQDAWTQCGCVVRVNLEFWLMPLAMELEPQFPHLDQKNRLSV